MGLLLSIVFIVICVLLIIIILLQKGRGGGLSGAFGGAGGHSAFGTKTGDVMTWTTVVLACLFLLSAVTLTLYYRPGDKGELGARAQPTPSLPRESVTGPPADRAEDEPSEGESPATQPAGQ